MPETTPADEPEVVEVPFPPQDDAYHGGAQVRVQLLIDWQDHEAGATVTVDANTVEDLLAAGIATKPKAVGE